MFSPCGASSRVRLVTNGSKSIKGIPAATSQTHKHTQGQRRINGKPNGCIFVSCFLKFFYPILQQEWGLTHLRLDEHKHQSNQVISS